MTSLRDALRDSIVEDLEHVVEFSHEGGLLRVDAQDGGYGAISLDDLVVIARKCIGDEMVREWGYTNPKWADEEDEPGPDVSMPEGSYADTEAEFRARAERCGGEVWTREVTEWRKA